MIVAGNDYDFSRLFIHYCGNIAYDWFFIYLPCDDILQATPEIGAFSPMSDGHVALYMALHITSAWVVRTWFCNDRQR